MLHLQAPATVLGLSPDLERVFRLALWESQVLLLSRQESQLLVTDSFPLTGKGI